MKQRFVGAAMTAGWLAEVAEVGYLLVWIFKWAAGHCDANTDK